MKSFQLNSNTEIPILGLGTWQISGKSCIDAVDYALSVGYRHLDTASMYRNEREIGKAVKDSEIDREEIFITSKVWRTDLGRENTKKSFQDTINNLQTDFLDLYLIHWPSNDTKKRLESYQVMTELRDEGKINAIGVSNFSPKQIEEIYDEFNEYPSVNQILFNPFNYKEENYSYCKKNDIVLTAYTPLNKGKRLNHPNINQLSEKYNKSNAQIVLRWFVDQGIVTIPKSSTPEHIRSNIDIFDFQLEKDEISSLISL